MTRSPCMPMLFMSMVSGWGCQPLSRSTLLSAMTKGILYCLRMPMHSTVCGLTPSLMSMTRTAMSARLPPRLRMLVKAACPGVSMVRMPGMMSWADWPSSWPQIFCIDASGMMDAPIACVMPPASFATIAVLLMVSRSCVFPASTFPIKTRIGCRSIMGENRKAFLNIWRITILIAALRAEDARRRAQRYNARRFFAAPHWAPTINARPFQHWRARVTFPAKRAMVDGKLGEKSRQSSHPYPDMLDCHNIIVAEDDAHRLVAGLLLGGGGNHELEQPRGGGPGVDVHPYRPGGAAVGIDVAGERGVVDVAVLLVEDVDVHEQAVAVERNWYVRGAEEGEEGDAQEQPCRGKGVHALSMVKVL